MRTLGAARSCRSGSRPRRSSSGCSRTRTPPAPARRGSCHSPPPRGSEQAHSRRSTVGPWPPCSRPAPRSQCPRATAAGRSRRSPSVLPPRPRQELQCTSPRRPRSSLAATRRPMDPPRRAPPPSCLPRRPPSTPRACSRRRSAGRHPCHPSPWSRTRRQRSSSAGFQRSRVSLRPRRRLPPHSPRRRTTPAARSRRRTARPSSSSSSSCPRSRGRKMTPSSSRFRGAP
mmetsp:Transcript_43705/g.117914  ORF Transcript_43705/g.117914 Transcript_43705/m.117914 type:complete len:229 (-) Transcript_43705:166-852(-)